MDSTVVIGKEEPFTKKPPSKETQQHRDDSEETSATQHATENEEAIDPDILGTHSYLGVPYLIVIFIYILVKSASLDPLKSHHKKQNPLITGLVTKEKAIATHSNLACFSQEKQKKLKELYDFLDVNNDGTIDIRDLTAALKKKRYFPPKLAPVRFKYGEANIPVIILGDFCQYEKRRSFNEY